LLKPGLVVVDCGCAPGSWTQVVVKRTNAKGEGETILFPQYLST
jgi:23S rRNA (uridine2552-2'-O)-methyltransferase